VISKPFGTSYFDCFSRAIASGGLIPDQKGYSDGDGNDAESERRVCLKSSLERLVNKQAEQANCGSNYSVGCYASRIENQGDANSAAEVCVYACDVTSNVRETGRSAKK